MRFTGDSFGSIQVDGVTYDHDLIIDRGNIRKRKKAASRKFRGAYGHTPLSAAEDIPWRCRRLVIGTGADGALPVMQEVRDEARRRKIDLVLLSAAEAIGALGKAGASTNAILHLTGQRQSRQPASLTTEGNRAQVPPRACRFRADWLSHRSPDCMHTDHLFQRSLSYLTIVELLLTMGHAVMTLTWTAADREAHLGVYWAQGIFQRPGAVLHVKLIVAESGRQRAGSRTPLLARDANGLGTDRP